jgi:2-dehydro-3-deoxygluconokinase
LSTTTPAIIVEALAAARDLGVTTSYDLNYRPSLWKSVGGRERAREVNRSIVEQVDVLFGNEEDFSAALGFAVPGLDLDADALDTAGFRTMLSELLRTFPNLRAVGTTLRVARTATRNDWGAILWFDGRFYEARPRRDLEILDRVGGGDSFASGVIYAMLSGFDGQAIVDYGAAHGALAMTTPGDVSSASLAEVEAAMRGGGARITR